MKERERLILFESYRVIKTVILRKVGHVRTNGSEGEF